VAKARNLVTTLSPELDGENAALRAANQAFGRKQRGVTRLASIELKTSDPRSSAWEAVAMASVGLLAVLVVVGVWLL
jgi:hypothetical protein